MPNSNNNTSLDQLNAVNSHDFVTIYSPKTTGDVATLINILQNNREFFIEQIAQRGVLLFRGFSPSNPTEFHDIITQGLGLEPWNAFNTQKMPAMVGSWMRKYTENLLGAGDYRRYLEKNTVQLGPVESSVQGPHTEGGIRSERSRYIALCCFEPAPHLAETDMVDLHQVYKELPEKTQQKYHQAWNRFYYITGRKVHVLDKMLLAKSPFTVITRKDGFAHLALPPCPMVCSVPETGDLCLQPWAFAKNTNDAAHASAVANFTGRGEILKDSTADGMNLTWELCDDKGESIAWSAAEQREMFDRIFERAFLMAWQKGDIALVDNIRIGHWRMNGEQGNRKLVQIQANAFNADLYQAQALAS